MRARNRTKMPQRELNPYVSVDCVIFGFNYSKLHVILVDRSKNEKGKKIQELKQVLPGNLIYNDEDLETAARRVLEELTGLKDIFLEEFGAFGDPNRVSGEKDQKRLAQIRKHPKARVVTIGFYSLVNMNDHVLEPSSFAEYADWIPVEEVGKLAFDHNIIFKKALLQLKQKLKCKPICFNLLPEKFTLAQLQRLYEVILDKELDKRNFRRKMNKTGILNKLDEKQKDVAHKPASYYSYDIKKYESLLADGFDDFGF